MVTVFSDSTREVFSIGTLNNNKRNHAKMNSISKTSHKRLRRCHKRYQNYSRIPHDCLHIIFQFHIQKMSHGTPLHGISQKAIRFISQYMVCFQFDTNFPVEAFLERIGCHDATEPLLEGAKCTHVTYIHAPYNEHICSSTFRFFSRVEYLNIAGCRPPRVTSDAFRFLKNVKRMNIAMCSGITDEAFQYLTGIEALDMSGCFQTTLTDHAFKYLRGIKHLSMSRCSQFTISDSAFEHLVGIETLDMSGCFQNGITDDAFKHLKGIKHLNICGCMQNTISDRILKYIVGLNTLKVSPNLFRERALKKLSGTRVEIKSMEMLALTYSQVPPPIIPAMRAQSIGVMA